MILIFEYSFFLIWALMILVQQGKGLSLKISPKISACIEDTLKRFSIFADNYVFFFEHFTEQPLFPFHVEPFFSIF